VKDKFNYYMDQMNKKDYEMKKWDGKLHDGFTNFTLLDIYLTPDDEGFIELGERLKYQERYQFQTVHPFRK
jgi:hypothetical protein